MDEQFATQTKNQIKLKEALGHCEEGGGRSKFSSIMPNHNPSGNFYVLLCIQLDIGLTVIMFSSINIHPKHQFISLWKLLL